MDFFDLYGTLPDPVPLSEARETVAPRRPAELATGWRVEQLRLTWLRIIVGGTGLTSADLPELVTDRAPRSI